MIFLLHSLIAVLVVLLIADYRRGRKTRARLADLESTISGFHSRIARTEAEVSDSISEELFSSVMESVQSSLTDFHQRTMELRREVQRAHGRLDMQGPSLRAHNAMAHHAEDLANGLGRQLQSQGRALSDMQTELAGRVKLFEELFGHVWTTQDGFTCVAPIMSDSHLRNAMKWIEERPSKYGPAASNKHYLSFKRELARRDNDDTWHQRLQGGPSPRRVLADAVQLAKSPFPAGYGLPEFLRGVSPEFIGQAFHPGMIPTHDEITLEFQGGAKAPRVKPKAKKATARKGKR